MKSEQEDSINYFNPWQEIITSQNHLPHWEQPGGTYFLTWRLADSIPQSRLEQFREEKSIWLKNHPEPWSAEVESDYHKIFSGRLDRWMDEGQGSCQLQIPAITKTVASAFLHFDADRYLVHSFVVMPNHIHILFSIGQNGVLSKIVHSWKSYTSLEINRLLDQEGNHLWQKDYFDRLIRNPKHFANCIRYIRNNPEKAKLRDGKFIVYESDFVSGFE